RRYLDGSKRAVLTVVGRKPAPVASPLDRAVAPAPAPAVPFRAPVPEVRTLRCGAALWVLPRRDLPIVAAAAAVPAGAGAHGPDAGGLASLTAAMMDEGTASRSARELAEQAERMATSLSASCGWDGSYVSLQCLAPHLDASLDLACDVLCHPSFPEAEWGRVRAQTLAALQAERDSAESRAYRALLRALYPPGHTYRVPVDGEEATVAALGRADLGRFHAAHYRPGRAAWVVAGDVDPDRLAEALDARLGAWTGSAAPGPEMARPADAAGPRILLLDRPGAAQAVLRVGHVGITRLDPDYVYLLVFNQILGGQFTSRLNARLREEKGFTYGVRSHFDHRRGPGPFSASAAVQPDRVAEALADLRGEVEALLGDRPPTAQEVDDARRALIEGQARHFETPSALISRYVGLFLHGLPPDDHARFAARLEAVTVDGLRAAAARHVRPEALVAVVVADASVVESPLVRLGWPHFQRIDETGAGDERG
ncbi:MAG TPA: pitrilysin family protein, partial [Isosphaeraceae bacterium]